jgi:hypothetical protein
LTAPAPGRVVAFDEARGLGELEGADGTRYPFQCTRIADGSRSIAPGAAVTFVVVAAPLGRWEAARIAKS